MNRALRFTGNLALNSLALALLLLGVYTAKVLIEDHQRGQQDKADQAEILRLTINATLAKIIEETNANK